MVSTRGLRYKFSEGERVLCYEPDPTKAKVLYDSKVLEVIESKDRRGRRTIEYLIHFQGWNSSWDRCVSEDFVLKDTEENRQLQRDLAEKSQLQLGAYLYRRERKKGNGSSSSTGGGSGTGTGTGSGTGTGTGTGTAKRPRLGFSDDGSSSSTQPEGEEGETVDTDSSGDGSGSQPATPPPSNVGRAHITLPSPLRDRLTFDYHLVVKRGRLSRLPASPCAAEILESFVKWYARAGAWHPARSRHDPPQKPDMLDVSCRLNLVREVADGLRVYFDFILRGHLLYKQEHEQYHEICGKFLDAQDIMNPEDHELFMKLDHDKAVAATDDIMKSPIAEYSHLPPAPLDPFKNLLEAFGHHKKPTSTIQSSHEEVKIKQEPVDKATILALAAVKIEAPPSKPEVPAGDETLSAPAAAGKMREGRSALRIGNVARRLRSHKSAVSQSENEEPTPSTSTGEPRTFETVSSSVGSSGSSLSEGWARPTQAATAAPTTTRTPLSLLLEKVAKWQIIPRNGTDHLPCRVYGAIHLARLFVKLPDFLNATQMPDYKLKMLLKHIDMFVQYLDENTEWFGETYYIADNSSRSH